LKFGWYANLLLVQLSAAMTLTFYFLQTSRAWRIAWLLEELGVEYDLRGADREADLSVPTSLGIPTSLGKSPAILDGALAVGESGAIAELVSGHDHSYLYT
jgi:glutathione S-transferase